MASATEDRLIDRLIDHGRRNGNRLSAEALGAALPVDSMTPEETAAVIERVEAAGIEVELDDSHLMRGRPGPAPARQRDDHRRGDGVVDMASPAAPAVSAPGAVPSRHGWADDIATGHAGGHHGGAPTWTRNGVEMLPLACVAAVAVVLIAALG
ncbi:RNA polymerase sigma factor region1.1 domain-containing protein [Azospirillum sp. B510]|uniref:RNA polymerase sigma factor region1.1 domain-containing protein n=1 Tax=Azospirillum sp. (strain B510) TaxID=137722 RepID=UPI0002D74D0A|nr:RNA polymerase sigma factor region1.1 domain-containing protein [Azospirillum sp. B510]